MPESAHPKSQFQSFSFIDVDRKSNNASRLKKYSDLFLSRNSNILKFCLELILWTLELFINYNLIFSLYIEHPSGSSLNLEKNLVQGQLFSSDLKLFTCMFRNSSQLLRYVQARNFVFMLNLEFNYEFEFKKENANLFAFARIDGNSEK